MDATTEKPAWSVTSQQETTRLSPAGQWETGVKVMFKTDTGMVGSVFVPETHYNAENIKKMVEEKVKLMHEVQTLQG